MARRILSQADYDLAADLVNRGVYIRDVAQRLGVHPRTVSRALRRGGPPGGIRRSKSGVLDPYKPLVDDLLARNQQSAVEILERLRAEGYRGSITTLQRYMKKARRAEAP